MGIKSLDLLRIAGEAKLILYQEEGSGLVDHALFIATAPVRGFEKLVVGKNPLFAIEAFMRICGVCHSSHGIAGCEAIEHALGVSPPKNGLYLREAIGLLNRVQSHLMQFIMIAPDIFREEFIEELVMKLMALHSKVSDYLTKLGGGATHPPNLTVGGILRPPAEATLNTLRNGMGQLIQEWRGMEDLLLDEDRMNEVVSELRKKMTFEYLATSMFYGDRYNLRLEDVEVQPYYLLRKEDEASKESNSVVALYGGNVVETGPRARLSIYKGFNNASLYGLHKARVLETSLSLHRIKELIEGLRPDQPFRTAGIILRPGSGVGVYEAPRGVLINIIELGEEGRVINSKIIVPTHFNIPVMEEAVKGLSPQAAEAAVRLYDPCIPCAVHVVRLGGGYG